MSTFNWLSTVTPLLCIDVCSDGVVLPLQLQELFSTYKKERVESDKTLMQQADKLQEQLSDLRSQNTKVSTQLEFASKR